MALIVIDVETRSSGMASNSWAMSSDGVDGHSDASRLAGGQRVVGVVADLRRQVEGDAETTDPLVQEIPVTPVGLLGRPEPGILPHGPEAPPVHGLVDASGERIVARGAELLGGVPALEILGSAQHRHNGSL